jgi:hypothetical protein
MGAGWVGAAAVRPNDLNAGGSTTYAIDITFESAY